MAALAPLPTHRRAGARLLQLLRLKPAATPRRRGARGLERLLRSAQRGERMARRPPHRFVCVLCCVCVCVSYCVTQFECVVNACWSRIVSGARRQRAQANKNVCAAVRCMLCERWTRAFAACFRPLRGFYNALRRSMHLQEACKHAAQAQHAPGRRSRAPTLTRTHRRAAPPPPRAKRDDAQQQ